MGDNLAQLLYTAFVNSGHEVAGSDVPDWASLPAVDRERWEQVATRARIERDEKQNDEIVMLRNAIEGWRRENDRLTLLINTPRTDDFFEAVRIEAAHQARALAEQNGWSTGVRVGCGVRRDFCPTHKPRSK